MTLEEVQTTALKLPDEERAVLAEELLSSLPVSDDEIAEAERRSDEMDRDPSVCCSWDEIKRAVGR